MIKVVCDGIPDQIVVPLIFPDSTSQVWKLSLDQYEPLADLKIVWNFEQEAELSILFKDGKFLKHDTLEQIRNKLKGN